MSNYSFRKASSSSSQTSESHRSNPSVGISNQEQQAQLPSVSPQDAVSSALNWGGILLTEADDLSNNRLTDIVPTQNLNGAMTAASAIMTGVESFQESPNQTTLGKGLDALLDVSGSLMLNANPVVGAVDSMLPKEMQLSKLYDGTSSAISTMAEGLVTGDTGGMEQFMENAKNGDYSIFVQEAVEAGEFWSKQWGQ